MKLPLATLDHVVINARNDMDHAADVYTRLGFSLTERGYHSLGSMNHLAMFGTDYLELIAIPKDATSGRLDLLTFPFGLNGLVFGSEDSAITYNALAKAGVHSGQKGLGQGRRVGHDKLLAGRIASLSRAAIRRPRLRAGSGHSSRCRGRRGCRRVAPAMHGARRGRRGS